MYIQRYRSRWGNTRTEYGGRKYMSKKEAGYARDLDLLIKAGEVAGYTPQYRLKLIVNGHHICDYLVDFLVTMKDGSEELHEVKGFETMLWNYKWKLTEALYGEKYKMVVIK